MGKRSKGRQKVDMVKMQNQSNLQVTFSKRRAGLFKKASELCTLCGAEVALVVFSPGKKVYSFGHPCVDSVVDRFLTRNYPPNNGHNQLIVAHRNANVRDLNMELTNIEGILQMEKNRGEALHARKRDNGHWWEAPIEELNLFQLQQLKEAMESIKKNVERKAHNQQMVTSNAFPFLTFGSALEPIGARARSSYGSYGSFPFQNMVSGLTFGAPSANSAGGSASSVVPVIPENPGTSRPSMRN
ncbi:agamous-like MADS-box protein AGL62 [Nicotiana tomentosiformis]|uniref:agamous-like MADS-box protein AGL62 n=1 Tax=Nicotiana tomentosiformis TaxID=4098 RepID=UPI00051B4FE8|nr:agamous-like MADS-box protein AGL62 [Nicotiana tomentosiformis]